MPKAKRAKGLRYNAGKPRVSLISPWALLGLAQVFTFGAVKYAAWNWAKGLSWAETVDSLLRHLLAFLQGEDVDPESGLPHIDHVQWNAHVLSHFQKTRSGTDDRWKGEKNTTTGAALEMQRLSDLVTNVAAVGRAVVHGAQLASKPVRIRKKKSAPQKAIKVKYVERDGKWRVAK